MRKANRNMKRNEIFIGYPADFALDFMFCGKEENNKLINMKMNSVRVK